MKKAIAYRSSGMGEEKPDMDVEGHGVKCGYIPLGTPYDYPQADPRKENSGPLSTREGRLHGDLSTRANNLYHLPVGSEEFEW